MDPISFLDAKGVTFPVAAAGQTVTKPDLFTQLLQNAAPVAAAESPFVDGAKVLTEDLQPADSDTGDFETASIELPLLTVLHRPDSLPKAEIPEDMAKPLSIEITPETKIEDPALPNTTEKPVEILVAGPITPEINRAEIAPPRSPDPFVQPQKVSRKEIMPQAAVVLQPAQAQNVQPEKRDTQKIQAFQANAGHKIITDFQDLQPPNDGPAVDFIPVNSALNGIKNRVQSTPPVMHDLTALPVQNPVPEPDHRMPLPTLTTVMPLPADPMTIEAQPAAPEPMPLDMTQTGWVENLTDRIEVEFTADGGELTLALTPENLGKLQIKMEMRDGAAHVVIVTDNAEASRLFANAENRLSDMLSRCGLTLAGQDTGTGEQGRRQGQSSGHGPAGPSVAGQSLDDPQADTANTRKDSLVNLIA